MTKKKQKSIAVGFVALGCPKNIVDSERMLAEIVRDGMVIVAELSQADVIVINTCGFIEPARQEALEEIKKAVSYKVKGDVKKIIVAGCLSQRWGAKLFDDADGIDVVVGLKERDNIARIIRKSLKSHEPFVCGNEPGESIGNDQSRLLITPSHWAYLRISEGCDHSCSFCTIPSIRGKFRSKPMDNIVAEAKELVLAGVVELNVIGQDTAYWGKDLKVTDGLAKVLIELKKIDKLKWIRLMYLYPVGITDRLIETIAKSKKIVHYLDIPIQHINNSVLKRMKRPDTKELIYGLIGKLREALPDVVLRTTVIVGFPGETDEEFAELIEFVKWAKFDALGCFKYYPEEGTEAAKMAGQVDEKVKQERLNKIMLSQQKVVFDKNKAIIGREITCLIDSVDEAKNAIGRFYGQAAEIDGVCFIENCSAGQGEFVKTKIIGTKDYDLVVEQI